MVGCCISPKDYLLLSKMIYFSSFIHFHMKCIFKFSTYIFIHRSISLMLYNHNHYNWLDHEQNQNKLNTQTLCPILYFHYRSLAFLCFTQFLSLSKFFASFRVFLISAFPDNFISEPFILKYNFSNYKLYIL